MKHDAKLLVPLPKEVTPIDERVLLDGSEVTITSHKQFIRRGQCFRLGDGSMARCASVRPRPDGEGGLMFDHVLESVSEDEVKGIFGDGNPEVVQFRRIEAQEVRRIARRLERYEGLKHLVPVMKEYADSLDGGCSR